MTMFFVGEGEDPDAGFSNWVGQPAGEPLALFPTSLQSSHELMYMP